VTPNFLSCHCLMILYNIFHELKWRLDTN